MMTSPQLKQRIRSIAKNKNVDSNVLLKLCLFDFFLEKLSFSVYVNHMIIKGGFFISAITGIDLRSTMDLDVTLKSMTLSSENITLMIDQILKIHTRDCLTMNLISIETIRENHNYIGYRASLLVLFDGIKEVIKIDLTTGDKITPSEMIFRYKTSLEGNELRLKSYNIETTIAEKIETILSRSIANTRMRDFYDIYILFTLKGDQINYQVLRDAIRNTFDYRKTENHLLKTCFEIIHLISIDEKMNQRWELFCKKQTYAKGIEWSQSLKAVSNIMILSNT